MELIFVTVFWCMAGTNFDDWNPHQKHVAEQFMAAHPKECFADGPTQLEAGISLDQCQKQAMLRWLPGWSQAHPGTVPIGVKCEARRDDTEKLDLEAMKRKVKP